MIAMHLSNTTVHYLIAAASERLNMLQLIVQLSEPRMVEDVLLALLIHGPSLILNLSQTSCSFRPYHATTDLEERKRGRGEEEHLTEGKKIKYSILKLRVNLATISRSSVMNG
jgi:hypothetical protein